MLVESDSYVMSMYVASRGANRGSPPAILLRENYREAGKVKSRTLANLTRWPTEKLEALEAVLKAGRSRSTSRGRSR